MAKAKATLTVQRTAVYIYCSYPMVCPLCKVKVPRFTKHACERPAR